MCGDSGIIELMEPTPEPTPTPYDSTEDTLQHIRRVRELLFIVINNLEERAYTHDQSKLGPVEKPIFDAVTPKLRGLTYGSEEYKASLAEMKPALDHHYAHNAHHPEHHPNGVNDMSLLDVLEMLCDWKAAGERHADGSITRSLEVNKKRFGISDQLQAILTNTAKEMNWI
jgi:hypothetical protein